LRLLVAVGARRLDFVGTGARHGLCCQLAST
jgi:hypothetical protein